MCTGGEVAPDVDMEGVHLMCTGEKSHLMYLKGGITSNVYNIDCQMYRLYKEGSSSRFL